MEDEHGSDDIDVKTIVVDAGQGQLRIDKYILDKLERVTRNKIQQAIKAGAILVNDKEIKSNYKVRPLDVISIVMPASNHSDEGIVPQDIPLDIIYEDDDVLVVNKPVGMVVHPGVSNPDRTLVNALAYYISQTDAAPLPENARERPGLVHRIDKDTSGLLVIAKNDFAMSSLAKQFFDHTIHRKYIALVWGSPTEPEGRIEKYIGRHPKDRTKRFVFDEDENGKHAITHYKTIEDMYYVSLIECQLETGRTHQIRVHMEHMGHPLFNDAKYNGRVVRKGTIFSKYKQFVHNCFELIEGQALHAAELGFTHPVTNERMEFKAPLPDGFEELLNRWRNYLANRKNHS
jgi:23S rRNA pseudouridine1911/1915/1917 synthase